VACVGLLGQGHHACTVNSGKVEEILVRARQAPQRPLRCTQGATHSPCENVATVGFSAPAQQPPNQRGFASTVGADDGVQLARRQAKVTWSVASKPPGA